MTRFDLLAILETQMQPISCAQIAKLTGQSRCYSRSFRADLATRLRTLYRWGLLRRRRIYRRRLWGSRYRGRQNICGRSPEWPGAVGVSASAGASRDVEASAGTGRQIGSICGGNVERNRLLNGYRGRSAIFPRWPDCRRARRRPATEASLPDIVRQILSNTYCGET